MTIKDSIKKGTLEMLLLELLAKEKELYGYQMVQIIDEQSNGILTVLEGSIYLALHKLEEKGYIASEKRQISKRMQRVYYSIKPEGIEYLEYIKKEYFSVNNAIQQILNYIPKSSE